jgi:hypothetical protein
MTMTWALILAMTSCKIPREYGDIVSRAKACLTYTDDGLVCPFGRSDGGSNLRLNSLERIT